MTPRIGSLFAGYGGLDLAAEEVFGGELAWYSEIDKGALKILEHRFPGIANVGSVTEADWSQVEPVDILTGGSPCQDLSHAGRRAGMTRGHPLDGHDPSPDEGRSMRPAWMDPDEPGPTALCVTDAAARFAHEWALLISGGVRSTRCGRRCLSPDVVPAERVAGSDGSLRVGRCVICGDQFETLLHHKTTCSEACKTERIRRTSAEHRRAKRAREKADA